MVSFKKLLTCKSTSQNHLQVSGKFEPKNNKDFGHWDPLLQQNYIQKIVPSISSSKPSSPNSTLKHLKEAAAVVSSSPSTTAGYSARTLLDDGWLLRPHPVVPIAYFLLRVVIDTSKNIINIGKYIILAIEGTLK
jgi:hypothetical protein